MKRQIEAGDHLGNRMPEINEVFLRNLGKNFGDFAPENQAQIVRETIMKL